jgi:hypothetical protein
MRLETAAYGAKPNAWVARFLAMLAHPVTVLQSTALLEGTSAKE